jgi:lipoic acid synthetase
VRHHPIERWVRPEEFVELQDEAVGIGFAGVLSGPLVRSSYRAGRLYQQAIAARDGSGGVADLSAERTPGRGAVEQSA